MIFSGEGAAEHRERPLPGQPFAGRARPYFSAAVTLSWTLGETKLEMSPP